MVVFKMAAAIGIVVLGLIWESVSGGPETSSGTPRQRRHTNSASSRGVSVESALSSHAGADRGTTDIAERCVKSEQTVVSTSAPRPSAVKPQKDGRVAGKVPHHFTKLIHCAGYATFSSDAPRRVRWTSHRGRVLMKLSLDLPRDEEFSWDRHADLIIVSVEKTFKQDPKGGGPSVEPFFEPEEMAKMRLEAMERFATFVENRQRGVPTPLDDFAVRNVSEDEYGEAHRRHEFALCEACRTQPIPCTGMIEVLEHQHARIVNRGLYMRRFNAMEACRRVWVERRQVSGRCMTLYHLASRQAAKTILSTKGISRGENGPYGPGIYFTRAPRSQRRHVCLRCIVFVGRIKHVDEPTLPESFGTLLSEGYDSLCGPGSAYDSDEDVIVVYNRDQVLDIVEQ